MKIVSTNRRTHSLHCEEGEVELEFEPNGEDNILAKRVGDRLVVAYLVRDDDGSSNPMENCDCQGDIYTNAPYSARDGVVTDNDSELYYALGLTSYGDINPEKEITVGGVTKPLHEFAAGEVRAELDHDDWCTLLLWCFKHSIHMELSDLEVKVLEAGECSPQRLAYLKVQHKDFLDTDLNDDQGCFSGRFLAKVDSLYAKHWQQIAGPLVVPIDYNRGSYDTGISVTTWDGDVNELPDGVWVADKGATENIGNGSRLNISVRSGKETYRGPSGYIVSDNDKMVAFFVDHREAQAYVESTYGDRPLDISTAARDYAHGVVSEYALWCSGEVFGCVVQTFTAKYPYGEEIEWIPAEDHDSCWGFIGEDYAMSSLGSDYFDHTVASLEKAAASI